MKKILTPLIIFIIIAACDDSPSGPAEYDYDDFKILDNQREGVIMPLATGNKWEYESVLYDENGQITDSGDYSERVLESADSMNNKGFYFDGVIIEKCPHPITNKNNGLWKLCFDGLLFFKYPAKKGDSYKSSPIANYPYLKRVVEGRDTVTKMFVSEVQYNYDIKVLSTNETVQTPGGKFKTYVYEINMCMDNLSDENVVNRYFKFKYFIAPNIGIVKINYYYEQNNVESDFKLWSENYLAHYELY